MGEVYRAHDATLARDVAIKVLPEAFASDPERLARFEREAKVLASLNHPNIAAIYGLERSGDTRALILELVEGPTLADRIASGPMPLDEALPIARQIAEALEAAHEQGIIHRDLKPLNIKVRDDGTVKVLDFGLAKALQPELSDFDAANSPTITAAATRAGVIMGTAPYMSPEQAKAKQIDKRTDIWAFGCVLYEMLTGQRAFAGETVAEQLTAVLSGTPDWDALPDSTPFLIKRLVRRCLERDRRERIPDSATARIEIADALKTPTPMVEGAEAAPVTRLAFWQRPISAAAAALGVALTVSAVTALTVWSLVQPAPSAIVRMPIPLGADESISSTNVHAVAISPNGRHIVYAANQGLLLRPVDQLEATPLAGTNERTRNPFFSPDGQWIGYWAGSSRQLKKISIGGGAPVVVGDAGAPWGASWGTDDTILFGQGPDGIWQVPGTGGTPAQIITMEEEERAHGPQMLPGGEWVLFTLRLGFDTAWDQAQIVAQSMATGERKVLIDGGRDGRYVPTGHLVYALDGVILGVPFDLETRAVTGGAVPLVEGIRTSTGNAGPGVAHFSLARTGSLVYVPGYVETNREVELVWVDRGGQIEVVGAEPRIYDWARVSPDGTRVAVDALDGDDNKDVWIYDLTRGTMMRLTFDEASDGHPLWTPDGSRMVFESRRDGGGLFWKAADGTGEVERLLESPLGTPFPYGWSADGRVLIDSGPPVVGGIGLLTVEGDHTLDSVFTAEFQQYAPAISPDGRWLAHSSDQSGRNEIYVRPFPDVDAGKWQVSADQGFFPVWSPDGRELFFLSRMGSLGELMVAQVETEPTFNASRPESLFSTTEFLGGRRRGYDIAPDGDRFLFLRALDGQATEEDEADEGLVFVQNWTRELLERVPVP